MTKRRKLSLLILLGVLFLGSIVIVITYFRTKYIESLYSTEVCETFFDEHQDILYKVQDYISNHLEDCVIEYDQDSKKSNAARIHEHIEASIDRSDLNSLSISDEMKSALEDLFDAGTDIAIYIDLDLKQKFEDQPEEYMLILFYLDYGSDKRHQTFVSKGIMWGNPEAYHIADRENIPLKENWYAFCIALSG